MKQAQSRRHDYKKSMGVFQSFKTFSNNAKNNTKLGDILLHNKKLTEQDLESLLNKQEATRQKLGDILVEENLLTPAQLKATLFQQWGMRLFVTTLTLCLTCFSFGLKKSHATNTLRGVHIPASLSSTANSAFHKIAAYPALFGTHERASSNIELFTKWNGMFKRFKTALDSQKNKAIIQQWESEIANMQSNSIYDMAVEVNDYINEFRYVQDQNNWGQSDYWATPVEFLTRGGDCEDFAIAKYASLKALGVPENRLRLAIVKDLKKNIPHAVLIVYTNRGALILDNQIKDVRRADTISSRYEAIYSINMNSWWLHTQPETTRVASVN